MRRIGSLLLFLLLSLTLASALWLMGETAYQLDRMRNRTPAAMPAITLPNDSPRELQPIVFWQEREAEAHEALDQVNALRRARGLRPFIFDEGLTRGAMNVARYRARRLIEGHTSNDFRGLPRGVHADAAGCAAWHGNDWGSCCIYEHCRFAGAAWCRGRDGRRYMHLFVRR